MPTFNPAEDIPELGGKVIVVTGGTSGLGKQSILALAAKKPARIILTGRDAKRADALIEQIATTQLTFVKCDMASLADVAGAAKTIMSQIDRLDILMCNAGVFSEPPGLSKDGYEVQFAINHLAHALLLKHLLPVAQHTPDARVVILGSEAMRSVPPDGIQFRNLRTKMSSFATSYLRYGQSKLANIVFAAELARRHPDITIVVVHPGTVATEMMTQSGFLLKSAVTVSQFLKREPFVAPEQGVLNQLWAAVADKSVLVSGQYYLPVGQAAKPSKYSADPELAEMLWEWTEEALADF
ncbi:Short-chain dehydrogenase reductase family [Mycena kentingensis (nom. inval.)]|nr:Short-chain dehydrogenase reductase family [Mycena kentingensis (nom. inval.)]